MSTSEKFCNDFIEIWNNNIGEFAKNFYRVGQRDLNVYVLHDDKKILQKIQPQESTERRGTRQWQIKLKFQQPYPTALE